ncbi:AraC family transcriptional regulator [Desulfitobacterium hafniense]|uniref:HTH araC/xylS-type domain-containing protein n=5 Tax=root TaxID=1 RepID=Q24YE0_DESHY|nr:AraC family transcriptional regulator [Desulfitobacterium hafniense]ACL20282.1 transcriptional regulator, AraC family [Desulfitobacterium hafniense DCB-2]EHL05713.1 transcriptional regulator, effector binding domain protein [Desulfitobacterium hafniense DP7]KTE90486.1 AraC family transcriptional regulator [Desulfitobacterium hafniense]MEA5021705.1 AraC family transcriptional regulator [Desulfitobacterium hafniense]CDX01086.1 Transcriptional regulator, AraC [Desulfitobacterium hafniense]
MLRELNHVIDYIEEHLTEELSLEIISEYAGVSDYHFRKIFFYLSGLTLSEYIKNRKLSEANKDLLQGETVTEVAFKYGYQSMDGFTRAFKKWSGFLPSDVIKKGLSKSFPKLSFVISVKGGTAMEFRIEDKPAFNLVGVSKRVPMQFEGVNKEIVKLAQSITAEQREEMHALQNIEPYEIINASYDADADFLKEEGDLTHLIGILTTENQVSDLLEKVPVEACTWAIFPNEGPFPSMLQDTMAKIYSEWLPSSNYEVIKAPAFSFTKMNQHKKDCAYSEVWIPVRKN